MMRGWVAVLLAIPMLAGCLGGDDAPERAVSPPDLGYDHLDLRIQSVQPHDVEIPGFQNTSLSAIIYEPITNDEPEGQPARFPVVVFMHPFGVPKEFYENMPVTEDTVPVPGRNVMSQFASMGIIAVAYDARGWFQSDGTSTIAGPAEVEDMRAVLRYIDDNFATNGMHGLAGLSYGGGQALLGWQRIAEVDTVVSMNGWTDLYDALVPGNVPKLEWGALFAGLATAETGAVRLSDDVSRWFMDAILRQNMDQLEREFDLRSTLDDYPDKPIFTCQGLQETAFHQMHRAWQGTEAFSRAYYYTGGHTLVDEGCLARSLDWFLFFLAGVDTEVDQWPAVETDAIDGGVTTHFQAPPPITEQTFYLDGDGLSPTPKPNTTWQIDQRLVANPFNEPSGVWDALGLPFQPVPAGMRQDPSGLQMGSGSFAETRVIAGAPRLYLNATNETRDGPWQVVATLYQSEGGNLRLLGRTAMAVIESDDHMDGWMTGEFGWTKLTLSPSDQFVVKIASNDPSVFAPLMQNYSVQFTGESHLVMPFFTPEPRGG